MKTKFLWIEDNARTDLKHLLAPIYMSGKYDPVVAPTVAEGVYRMKFTEFAAVIVDIRLLPGNDKGWEDVYTKLGSDKGTARLGLYMLYSLFGPRLDDVKIEEKPLWIKPERFGVLTVEDLDGDVGEALKSFGISVYEQKTARTPNTTLLRMVERITGGTK
jgi:hypothetical protein